MGNDERCPLCDRVILPGYGNVHHLVPKLKGGRKGDTAYMHIICHSKLHSLYSEVELATNYNTIELLLQQEAIQKFVKWIKKRPLTFKDSNRQSSDHTKSRKKR
jgi:5-methylcytosine-specific restriction endonuclease McrA